MKKTSLARVTREQYQKQVRIILDFSTGDLKLLETRYRADFERARAFEYGEAMGSLTAMTTTNQIHERIYKDSFDYCPPNSSERIKYAETRVAETKKNLDTANQLVDFVVEHFIKNYCKEI